MLAAMSSSPQANFAGEDKSRPRRPCRTHSAANAGASAMMKIGSIVCVMPAGILQPKRSRSVSRYASSVKDPNICM